MDVSSNFHRNAVLAGALVFVLFVISAFFSRPLDFPKDKIITIKEGESLTEVSNYLTQEGVIDSPSLFKFLVFITSKQGDVRAGDYLFEKPHSIFDIYKRVLNGISGIESVRVVIKEGWTAYEIGRHLEDLGLFTIDRWLEVARRSEGFLFPDTYFFAPEAEPEEVTFKMLANFDNKIDESLRSAIEEDGKTLDEIIIMASLVEKESGPFNDAPVIAGILWKRIEIGMGLQVDATLTYLTGKSSRELTQEDLSLDDPYNTYKYRGLPPGPIGNPGLEAIEASVFPEESPYLFYLHDDSGRPHYAETFEGHKRNKELYLR